MKDSLYLVKTEKGEHFGEIDNNVYGFIVDMANDLVSTMEKVSPLFGTLTRTALADNLPQDDGTAMHCLRTAQEIIHTLTDVIACQFEMNDVLNALCMSGWSRTRPASCAASATVDYLSRARRRRPNTATA